VVRTRVGYTGGTTADPSYMNLGDHIETVEIEYDPGRISYQELLDVFWASDTPMVKPYSRQYAPVIFFHNEEQKRLALESRDRAAARAEGPIYAEVLPAVTFYQAEDYHQKYWLRHRLSLMKEFRAYYRDDADLIRSTAAARVNGYVAGYGTPEALGSELASLGLSAEESQRLMEMVQLAARRRAALE
jgi:peptide-methionine (S)-S-oxide reductase